MGTKADLIGVLQSFVGIKEAPDGSNMTPIGAEFGWNGVAWCCETVSVALKRAGVPGFWTAGVLDARERAKRGENGMQFVPFAGAPQPGDAILFDWTGGRGTGSPDSFHIGTIIEVVGDTFHTIEGNTSSGCAWVWRDRAFVQGFIRFPFDAPVPTPTPQEGDLGWPSFTDPKNGNKVIASPKGDFYNYNSKGAPGGNQWLGNLSQFNAGEGTPNGPLVAIEPWDDGGSFSGIIAFCVDAVGKVHPYALPSNGVYGYGKK